MNVSPQELLAAIIESSDDAIISKTLEGIITSWNKGAEKVFGYTPDEAISKPITILIPDNRLDEEPIILEKVRRGEKIDHYETVRKRKDGALIDISVTISPIRDSTGQIIGASKVARDITALKKTKELQSRLALIIESSDDAIISKNLEGIITSWNKGAEKIFGYTADEVIGKSINILVPSDRFDEEIGILERLKRGELVDHYETIRVTKDGRLRNMSITISPLKDHAGRIVGASKIARDITAHKQAERVIHEQKEWLQMTLTSIGDAVVATNANGNITFLNPIAESLTGWKQEEAIGRPLEDIFNIVNEETLNSVESPVRKVLREGTIVGLANHTLLISKQGEQIPIDDSGSPIRNLAGEINGVILVFRDVSEKRRSEREISQLLMSEQAARKQAEETNRIKDEFIATVSDELRTPLTAMLGWTRLLRSSKLDAKTASNAIETIERNVKSQARLIEDLLDISRITSGKLRLNLQPVDLGSVIKAASEATRLAATAKKIKLQMTLSADAPVYGDYERLQQVVWNLLSNAIKFTPKGGNVQIQLDRIDSEIELTITDTGQGIKAEFLPHIFSRFSQADSSITRLYGGLGLGLSIVKHLVELHGGIIKVYSAGEGQGSTFTVILPAMTTEVEADNIELLSTELSTNVSVNQNALNDQKILVVDDEPDSLILVKTIFEQCGATVKTANSVEVAIEILEEWSPTVLVSDIGMPGRDGIDLIRYIRSLDEAKGGKTPAVALTAFARVEDRMKVLAAGYQMHVPKPVEPSELITIVSSLTKFISR